MVNVSTNVVGPRGKSSVKDEIERLRKVQMTEDKAFKAQEKMTEAIHAYGAALGDLLDLGQSKTYVARRFGITPRAVRSLVEESRHEDSEATPPSTPENHQISEETRGDSTPAY